MYLKIITKEYIMQEKQKQINYWRSDIKLQYDLYVWQVNPCESYSTCHTDI